MGNKVGEFYGVDSSFDETTTMVGETAKKNGEKV